MKQEPEKVRDIPEWRTANKPWGVYPEKALMSSSECHYLYDMVKRLGKGNYANLGTYKGASAACMAFALKEIDAGLVYTIDSYEYENLGRFPEQMVGHMKELDIYKYVKLCIGKTNEWAEKLKDKKFNGIFIDAGHKYNEVIDDFTNWNTLLVLGGELAFHDILNETVNRAVEDCVSEDWECVRWIWNLKVFKRK